MQTGGVMKQQIGLILLSAIMATSAWAVDAVKNPAPPKHSVMVFVSMSMPRQSLIATLHDANKIQASVVMRGLVHNSFKETFQEVESLVKEAGGGGIELNPLAFKKFNIETVPAVVVISPDNPCLSQQKCDRQRDYDVMAGNIPLAAALKEIRDRGVVAPEEARHALNVLQEGANV
jgi:conjugal transfer pilus assembly protein TrbC